MKIKTLVAMLFLSAGATTVVAQDASNCNSNSSISHEAVRAGNFKDAYTPWKAVLENCPTLRFYTFTDGYKILKALIPSASSAEDTLVPFARNSSVYFIRKSCVFINSSKYF